jgi:hypothetical protein
MLREIDLLEKAHAATPKPAGYGLGREKARWAEAEELGPRIAELSGSDQTERKRKARSLAVLAAKGLVQLGRACGNRITNVKLTDEGRKAIYDSTIPMP